MLESFQLYSSIDDECIIVMEVLPKQFVLLDGIYRLCTQFVLARIEIPTLPDEDINFQCQDKIL